MKVGSVLIFASVTAACGGAPVTAPTAPHSSQASLPPGFSQVTSMCARITSCARPFDPPSARDPSQCVDHLLLHGSEDDSTKCLARAKTCKEISQCLHGDGDAVAATFCNAHPGVLSACDGTHFITCADPVDESNVVDCAKIGANCSENKLEGGLVVRGCTSPSLCPAGAPETRCASDHEVVSCRDGIVDRSSCKDGDHCIVHHDPDGELAACAQSNERKCADVGAGDCDGDKVVECVSDGHFGRIRTADCKAHGLTCAAHGRAAGCVAESGAPCTPFPARCDGGFLEYCAEGVIARVSCAEIGLGVCDPSAHGPEAACRPRP